MIKNLKVCVKFFFNTHLVHSSIHYCLYTQNKLYSRMPMVSYSKDF